MATFVDTNATIVALLSGSAIVFFAQHTYKFDKWQCLVPRKKDWFRVILTWMLMGSLLGIFTWGTAWCVAKYQLGWVYLPDYGAVPYPPQMFTQKYITLNKPTTVLFSVAFTLQTVLNAEEGLYWYHLMRAVRQPKSAKSWLTSNFFYAWVTVSIVMAIIQCTLPWVLGGESDMITQMARMMTVDGAIEFVVMAASSVVILKFPVFLNDVKASGASPDVRSRLHFYHETNKVRTFFRFLFSACMIILGVDGLTEKQLINNNNLANDLLSQIIFGSYFFIIISSTILYLPRNWSPESERRAQNVLVGEQYPAGNARSGAGGAAGPVASGVALMSLLREGGQWDADDDLRAGGLGVGGNLNDTSLWNKEMPSKESDWSSDRISQPDLPMVIEHFTSPIAIQTVETIPTEIRIHVNQEVHRDADDYV